VATAMHEMTATVQEVAGNIGLTADSAREAREETEAGAGVVAQAKEQIRLLADQIEASSQTIAEVEQHSEAINAVLEVIRGVAEQTNLLALNAAIEAARAGEQGRGFAVVADEVRTLAGRTQESTEEINEMIEKLQACSRRAVAVMARSREQSGQAVAFADQSATALAGIADKVRHITDMSHQIASAAEEQRAVSEEINRNIVRACRRTSRPSSPVSRCERRGPGSGPRWSVDGAGRGWRGGFRLFPLFIQGGFRFHRWPIPVFARQDGGLGAFQQMRRIGAAEGLGALRQVPVHAAVVVGEFFHQFGGGGEMGGHLRLVAVHLFLRQRDPPHPFVHLSFPHRSSFKTMCAREGGQGG